MEKVDLLTNHQEKIQEIIARYGKLSRLGKAFKTNSKHYFYDTGTGKVLECQKSTFFILQHLLEDEPLQALNNADFTTQQIEQGLSELEDAIQNENILAAPPITRGNMTGPQVYSLEKNINENVQQLTLEVTEKCNLRCRYCIYSEDSYTHRNFSSRDMDFNIAKKAIDYAYKHSDKSLFLGFYGGEPLMNFPLIKSSTQYAMELFKDKQLSFSITTNATLVTEEIATFLATLPECTVMISFDGSPEVHDANRVFSNGTGSYEAMKKGVLHLRKAFEGKEERLLLSMVIAGPSFVDDFEKIQNYFDTTGLFPPNINKTVNYVAVDATEHEYVGVKSDYELDMLKVPSHISDPLDSWTTEKVSNSKNAFSESYIDADLLLIHKRNLVETPMQYYTLNGCCVPGARRLYTAANGDYYPCEKVGTNCIPLGNVDDGVLLATVKKYYVDDFITEAARYCNDCWASQICGNCYINSFDSSGINFKLRHFSCMNTRRVLERSLIKYHEILESNPSSLERYNQIELI